MSCPKCGSDLVRAVRMLFESGTSLGSFVGVESDGSVFGGGTSQQSVLARRLAPPRMRSRVALGVAGFGVGAILNALVFTSAADPAVQAPTWTAFVGLIALVGTPFFFVQVLGRKIREQNERVPELRRQWEASYLCQRCGTMFVSESYARELRAAGRL